MKRSVLLISAFAVFGLLFTQCKKNTEVLPVVPTGEKINVSLNIPNNGGSKTSISDNGTIVWTGNDKIVVCYTEGTTTGVAGILSITNNVNTNVATFTGQITLMGDQTAENFASYSYDFHYLGTNFSESAITNSTGSYNTSYTLDFTNQDGTLASLPELQYAMGTGNFKNVNGNWTANLNLLNRVCLFSYDVTDMVDQTNTYAVDNFYMTFTGSVVPNTKLTVGFTGGYTYDNTTKSIYVGKPTKQSDGSYKLYVILPGYDPSALPGDVNVQFFSDSYSQNAAITHPSAYFGYNSYNGGTSTNVTSITNATYMLDENCTRGIFKTATGRLIRFANGNLYTTFSGSLQSPSNIQTNIYPSQVNACLGYNGAVASNMRFDDYAFGATGVGGAPSPLNLYNYQSGTPWYYTGGTSLTGDYDYGVMLSSSTYTTSFATMTTDDYSAFNNTNYNIGSALYTSNVTSSKAVENQYILYIVNNKNIKPTSLSSDSIQKYEDMYNAIFMLCAGYNSNPSKYGSTSWQYSPSYYWIADGNSNSTLNMLNASTGNIESVDPSDVEGEGYPVRLVHTEFNPN